MAKRMHPEVGYGTDFYMQSAEYNAEKVRLHTLQMFERLWYDSIAENIPIIRGGYNLGDFPKQGDKPALVIGAGPSIADNNQLEALFESNAYQSKRIFVVACEAILKRCLEVGIIPDLVVTMDGTPLTTGFFKDVERVFIRDGEPVPIAASAIIHPDTVYEAVRVGNLWWYVPLWDDIKNEKSYTRVLFWMTGGKTIIQTLGNVGANSVIISCFLGCKEVGFIGLDFGYPADYPLEKTQYYKTYLERVKLDNMEIREDFAGAKRDYKKDLRTYRKYVDEYQKRYGKPIDPTQRQPPDSPKEPQMRTIAGCYRYVINKDTDTHVLVSLNWDVYRNIFLTFVRFMNPKYPLINLSPTSSLYGEGISTQDLANWLEEWSK